MPNRGSDQKRYTLWGDRRSGNCYKVALMLRLRGLDFEWRETDVIAGTTRRPEFLAMNPNGRVPLLRLPGDELLAESNAMLLHLAEGTPLLPADAYRRALAYQWLFFEQYSHEPYLAVRRFLLHFEHGQAVDPGRLDMLLERGRQALAVMDRTLSKQPWIVGDDYSIADISLYAYTHVAHQGGYDLAPYPAVTAWLARTRSRPGHFDMEDFEP